MNDFSALRLSDSELASPEAVAPDGSKNSKHMSALHARQLKLRRIVLWIVGGAALLTCAGLVRAATRSSITADAQSATASAPQNPTVLAQAALATPSSPPSVEAPSTTTNSAEPNAAASADNAAVATPAPAAKPIAHVGKVKAKPAKQAPSSKVAHH